MAKITTQQEGDDDRLSNLPDDILLLILNKLDLVRDAARTTVLSKRWRHLLGLRPEIVLDVLNFDATPDQDDDLDQFTMDDLARTNASVVEATRSILQQHRRQRTTIQLLDITFFLRDESIGLVRAVDHAMADHIILAAGFTILPDADIYCPDDDVLLGYGRRFMTFFDACPRAFASLEELNLHTLRLGETDIANVLSTCKKLEYFGLVNCDTGTDDLSVLQVEHSQLVALHVILCGFGTVELKRLPRLTRVTCKYWPTSQDQYPLSFGYVPQLRVLKLTDSWTAEHKAIKLSEFLPGNHGIVAELDLNFHGKKIWIQPEGPKRLAPLLRNLRVVTLRFIHEEYGLMWTLFILESAPLLHTLDIKMSYHRHTSYSNVVKDDYNQTDEDTQENLQREADLLKWETHHDFKHYNMKKITIEGFQVEVKFTRYIRRVMEAAVNLEVVSLSESRPCLQCEYRPSTVYPRTHKGKDLIKKQISDWRSSPIHIEIV